MYALAILTPLKMLSLKGGVVRGDGVPPAPLGGDIPCGAPIVGPLAVAGGIGFVAA